MQNELWIHTPKDYLIEYLNEKSKTKSAELILRCIDKNKKSNTQEITEDMLYETAVEVSDNEDMFEKVEEDLEWLEQKGQKVV